MTRARSNGRPAVATFGQPKRRKYSACAGRKWPPARPPAAVRFARTQQAAPTAGAHRWAWRARSAHTARAGARDAAGGRSAPELALGRPAGEGSRRRQLHRHDDLCGGGAGAAEPRHFRRAQRAVWGAGGRRWQACCGRWLHQARLQPAECRPCARAHQPLSQWLLESACSWRIELKKPIGCLQRAFDACSRTTARRTQRERERERNSHTLLFCAISLATER